MSAGGSAKRYFFPLTGKSRDEIAERLKDATREELVDVIFALASYDRMLTARQIAEAEQIDRRAVLADMKAGRFVDPVFGPCFFARASNSFRVTAASANAYRRLFLVPVRPGGDAQADPIPGEKKERRGRENGVRAKRAQQRRAAADLAGQAKPGDT
jgi:hypothetical protein